MRLLHTYKHMYVCDDDNAPFVLRHFDSKAVSGFAFVLNSAVLHFCSHSRMARSLFLSLYPTSNGSCERAWLRLSLTSSFVDLVRTQLKSVCGEQRSATVGSPGVQSHSGQQVGKYAINIRVHLARIAIAALQLATCGYNLLAQENRRKSSATKQTTASVPPNWSSH